MITYQVNEPVPVEVLKELYNSVEWTGYTQSEEVLNVLLAGAYSYITAWDEDKLVGLVRTISDGVYILYIQDLLVRPEYQRQGIGRSLMEQMLESAKKFRQVILSTDNTEKTKTFYHSVGLKSMEELDCLSFMREY